MGRSKIKKWDELETFDMVFQKDPEKVKGKWHEEVFKNEKPITLELGCGKGEYTVELSSLHPERNFIGVDLKGARIWAGAKKCKLEGRTNTAWIRSQIDHITEWFSPNEVDEIWITFPDPQPQANRIRKRLTHPVFLDRYRQFLKPDGLIHLKTDNTDLYEFSLRTVIELKLPIIHQTNNLYASPLYKGVLQVKTHYESLFTEKGEDIKYLCFQL